MEYKGITLTLSMEDREFNSTINRVKQSTKALNGDINNLKKSLKLDPGNLQAYTVLQDKLKDKIDETWRAQNALRQLMNEGLQTGQLEVGSHKWIELTTALTGLNNEFDKLKGELKDLDGNNDIAKKTTLELGESFDETGTKALSLGDLIKGNLLSSAIIAGLKGLVNIFKRLISGYNNLMMTGIEYNAQMQSFEVSLRAIGEANGDAEKSTDNLIKRMKAIGQTSSFSSSALLEAAQQLAASGVSMDEAGDSIENLQKLLAYAGKGDDELSRMAQNLNQIKNAGKATAADLKQFAYAGIPVYKLLADYSEEFNSITKDTVVTYKDLAAAFSIASQEGSQYFDANEIQLSTFQGQMSQLKSQWEILWGELALSTTDALTETVLPAFNNFIGELITGIQDERIQEAIIEQMGETGKLIDPANFEEFDFAEIFSQGISDVIDAVMESGIVEKFLEAANLIAEAFRAAFDPSTDEGKKNMDALSAAVGKVLDVLLGLLTSDGILSKFVDAGTMIGAAFVEAIWAQITGARFDTSSIVAGYAADMAGQSTVGSGGFGAIDYGRLQAGGFGHITLNASFTATNLDESSAMMFADMIADEINERLGGEI